MVSLQLIKLGWVAGFSTNHENVVMKGDIRTDSNGVGLRRLIWVRITPFTIKSTRFVQTSPKRIVWMWSELHATCLNSGQSEVDPHSGKGEPGGNQQTHSGEMVVSHGSQPVFFSHLFFFGGASSRHFQSSLSTNPIFHQLLGPTSHFPLPS